MLYPKWQAERLADELTAKHGRLYRIERVARGEWKLTRSRTRHPRLVRQARLRMTRREARAVA